MLFHLYKEGGNQTPQTEHHLTKIPNNLNEDLKGPWLDKSISEQRKELAKWIAAGNRPDDHPLVRSVEIRPPEGVTPETIAEVELKASYKRQDWFHCNDCGTKSKFKDRGQIMSFGDGYLYLVGPDCGNDLQKEMKRQGRKSFRRQMDIDSALERLLEFRPKASQWALTLRSVEAIAEEVLIAQKQISLAKKLYDALSQCRKAQGTLTYLFREERADNDPDKVWGKYKFTLKEFPVRIKGTSLFETPLPILASIKELRQILNELDVKNAHNPNWLECMQGNLGGEIALKRTKYLTQLPGALEQCSTQIKSAQEFFSKDNLVALNEWVVRDNKLHASMQVQNTNFKFSSSELPEGSIEADVENLLKWA